MKYGIGILKAPVTVKQRMSIRIRCHSLFKSIIYKWIAVALADYICDNSTVIQIKYCAEINLSFLASFVVLEFCYICKPFLIWCICPEVALQYIL